MDDYEYEEEFEEEDDFEEEVEIEEEDFEEEVEEEDFEEEVEDEEDDFEEEEEDYEEIEEHDDLIPLEMTSLRVYEEEEASELVPLGMTSHRVVYENGDDYMEQEVDELIPVRMTSPRVVYEDEGEQLDELIPLEITSPSPRVVYEDEGEQVDELIPLEITSPRVLHSISDGRALQGTVAINDALLRISNECEGNLQGNHENGGAADVCPICFETWTNGGDHQVCCLPCGHVYGMSCINKWLQSSGKCPQCKSLCTLKDIIVLYATRLYVADEELHKASTTNFPFTRGGFSALQQYAFSLQQRLEAMNLKTDYLCSRMNSLEQRCKEHMGCEQENIEH